MGKDVNKESMCDLMMRSVPQQVNWLVIARELKLTNQMLVRVFLEAWKDSDATGRSWKKLATALKSISESGDFYKYASEEAEKNAGTFVTNFAIVLYRRLGKVIILCSRPTTKI